MEQNVGGKEQKDAMSLLVGGLFCLVFGIFLLIGNLWNPFFFTTDISKFIVYLIIGSLVTVFGVILLVFGVSKMKKIEKKAIHFEVP